MFLIFACANCARHFVRAKRFAANLAVGVITMIVG
jgi:hypothetical protein